MNVLLKPNQVLFPEGNRGGDIAADTDWATGVVRLFMHMDQWNTVLSLPDDADDSDERYTTEIITHEALHVLHMLTTGYAYELSLTCYELAMRAVKECGTLDKIYINREKYRSAVEPHFRHLEQAGPDGLSNLDLMESVAFLVQKRAHYPAMGPASYETKLNEEIFSQRYRGAYDIAVAFLGEDAFEELPHIVSLSLMTSNPVEAFIPLIRLFKQFGSSPDQMRKHQAAIVLLNEKFGDTLLGGAWERIYRKRSAHPLLLPAISGCAELVKNKKVPPLAILARPHSVLDELSSTLGPLVLLEPRAGEKPAAWPAALWQGREEFDERLEPASVQFVCAVSMLLSMEIDPIPEQEASVRGVSASYDRPRELVILEVLRHELNEETVDHLADFIASVESDPSAVRHMRGMLAITFSDDEFEGSPFIDGDVRAFLNSAYGRVPHLLYYLVSESGNSAMLGCAAAHSPNSAVKSDGKGGINLKMTRAMLKEVRLLLRAAAVFSRQRGDDPLVQLGSHLDLFQDSHRTMLRKEIAES